MKKGSKEKVTLGSGMLYLKEFTGELPKTFKELLTDMLKDENHAGWIKNGASIEYKPTMTTEKDDLGKVVKEILTDEEATFKTGLFTWNGDTLAKMSSTAAVTTEKDEEKNISYRVLRVGGAANDNGKQYVLLFVHEDPVEGNCYLAIVGRNAAGFTITFAADSATVIDAEFTCKPQDSRGTLIQFVEEIDEEFATAYTAAELNTLSVNQIKTIASAKGYEVKATTKAEMIEEVLTQQAAAQKANEQNAKA